MGEMSALPNQRRKPKNPEGNRSAILAAAIKEFADRGFGGARVDRIASASGCDKQMIYYYFGNKEATYIATLEHAYELIRHSQAGSAITVNDPLQSLCHLIVSSFDFVLEHTELMRLISNENTERAAYIKKSKIIRTINMPIIERIDEIIRIGIDSRVFRSDINALELHHITSALINHYFNNAYTFGYIFDVDFSSNRSHDDFKVMMRRVISRYVSPTA